MRPAMRALLRRHLTSEGGMGVGSRLLLVAAFAALWPPISSSAVAGAASGLPDLCRAAARVPTQDTRLQAAVRLAQQQHALFGGQWIDRRGTLAAVGYHEAEFDRPAGESTPTWARVAGFWQALGPGLPASFRGPDGRTLPLPPSPSEPQGRRDPSLSVESTDERWRRALDSAALRAALVDQPWSAVFISFLLKRSGFAASEFNFSDTHADYVDQAVLASDSEARDEATPSVYRACDIASTPPRAGDLVCHTREDASGLRSLTALRERLAMRRIQPLGNGVPMHCDLVTRADEGGDAKLETIGGNVVQSVTLRQMSLDARRILSRRHFAAAAPASCRRTPCAQDLNRRPWTVLLQFRH